MGVGRGLQIHGYTKGWIQSQVSHCMSVFEQGQIPSPC